MLCFSLTGSVAKSGSVVKPGMCQNASEGYNNISYYMYTLIIYCFFYLTFVEIVFAVFYFVPTINNGEP